MTGKKNSVLSLTQNLFFFAFDGPGINETEMAYIFLKCG
jgi:hypothetical protein